MFQNIFKPENTLPRKMERQNSYSDHYTVHRQPIPKRHLIFSHTFAEVPIAMKFSVLPGSGFDKGPLYSKSPSGTTVINSRERALSKQGLMGRNHA